MWRDRRSEHVSEMFAEQFEENGDRYLYRRYRKGAAFQVSAAERERFIKQFDRRYAQQKWGLYGLIFLTAGGGSILMLRGIIPEEFFLWVLLVPVAVLVPVFIWLQLRLWNEPMRQLANRLPVARERSRAEMQQIIWKKLTWTTLGFLAVGSFFPLMYMRWDRPLLSGFNLFYLALMTGCLGLITVQAIRKFLYERSVARGDR